MVGSEGGRRGYVPLGGSDGNGLCGGNGLCSRRTLETLPWGAKLVMELDANGGPEYELLGKPNLDPPKT